jgi:SAM-dependent methyltransferase
VAASKKSTRSGRAQSLNAKSDTPKAAAKKAGASKKPGALKKRGAKKRKPTKSKYTAKTADKQVLYQLSVQDADFEVDLLTRVFKRLRGRKPLSMREDFCGTALFCAAWVKSDKTRSASGVDLDPKVLEWGVKHNLAPIEEPGKRITLHQKNVLDDVPGRFDITVAFNFSYWCFKTRETLRSYFEKVRSSLVKDGLFFLDAYGGYESHEPDLEEPRKVEGGFTYIWHQDKVDPINNGLLNHIHFHFQDGTKMRKAFSYDWRFWSLQELKELLLEAGFSEVEVYWEDADEDGNGNGVYRPRRVVQNEAGWIAYLVAKP